MQSGFMKTFFGGVSKGGIMTNRKKIVFFPNNHVKDEKNNRKKDKIKKVIGKIGVGIGLASGVIGIIVFLTGKNLPDYFLPDKKTESIANSPDSSVEQERNSLDYFVSVAVSDTLSSDFEPAKKIVVTASADTTNMTLTSESETESFGPFNMTMESSRCFIFLAFFNQPGKYTITITAYSEEDESTKEEISIDV